MAMTMISSTRVKPLLSSFLRVLLIFFIGFFLSPYRKKISFLSNPASSPKRPRVLRFLSETVQRGVHAHHGREHREDNHADYGGQDHDYQRLQQRHYLLRGDLNFLVVIVRQLHQHGVDVAGLLADVEHVVHQRRKEAACLQRFRKRQAHGHVVLGLFQRIPEQDVVLGVRRDVDGVYHWDARGQKRGQGAGHAGAGGLHVELAENLARDTQPAEELGALRGLLGEFHSVYGAHDDKGHDVPVVPDEVADGDDRLGDAGKLDAHVAEHAGKLGNDEGHEHAYDGDGDNDHDDGVNGGFLNGALQLGVLLKLCAHAGEGHVQTAGGLARVHHGDEHIAENVRVFAHGLGQRGALFDVHAAVPGRGGQPLVLGLLLQHAQRVDHGDAGGHDADELAAEHGQISGAGLFIEKIESYFLVQRVGLDYGNDDPAGLLKLRDGRFAAFRGHGTLHFFSIGSDGHICECRQAIISLPLGAP